jgi:hypothetical protein
VHGTASKYLTNCCTSVAYVVYRQRLRFASRCQVVMPRYRLSTYERRAFSAADPTVRNALPRELTSQDGCTGMPSALEISVIMRCINRLPVIYVRNKNTILRMKQLSKHTSCNCATPADVQLSDSQHLNNICLVNYSFADTCIRWSSFFMKKMSSYFK